MVGAALFVAACGAVEDSDEFRYWSDRFFSEKYERSQERWYEGFAWYRSPPWTESEALEQLAYHVAVDYPLDNGIGFAVFDSMLDGTAQPFRGRSWRVMVPPIQELDVGESEWEIRERGGYGYVNKAAAQIADCLHIDLARSDSDPEKIIRLNVVDCPVD